MAGAAVQRRLTWLVAEVVSSVDETPRVRTITLECPGWPGHLPGQHIDIRLTAEDGYQAQRSYSLATPTDDEQIAITVETVVDGEVSPYLNGELRVGDLIELRGPIGGYFVWEPGGGRPLQLIGGGSGVVPLMAMVRAHVRSDGGTPVRLLVSARSHEDIIYREELEGYDREISSIVVDQTLTRFQPPGWPGPARRVDRQMLQELAFPPAEMPECFICGPTGFVETVATTLVDLGHVPDSVRTERFGPTGG